MQKPPNISPLPTWAPPIHSPTDDLTHTRISWGHQPLLKTLSTVLRIKNKFLTGPSLGVQPHFIPFSLEFSSVTWSHSVPFCCRASAQTSLCCGERPSSHPLSHSPTHASAIKQVSLPWVAVIQAHKSIALFRAFISVCNYVIVNCCAF